MPVWAYVVLGIVAILTAIAWISIAVGARKEREARAERIDYHERQHREYIARQRNPQTRITRTNASSKGGGSTHTPYIPVDPYGYTELARSESSRDDDSGSRSTGYSGGSSGGSDGGGGGYDGGGSSDSGGGGGGGE